MGIKALEFFVFFVSVILWIAKRYKAKLIIHEFTQYPQSLCMPYQYGATLLRHIRTVSGDLVRKYCFFLALLFYNIVQLMNKLGDSTNRSSLSLTLRLLSNPGICSHASLLHLQFLSNFFPFLVLSLQMAYWSKRQLSPNNTISFINSMPHRAWTRTTQLRSAKPWRK